MSLFSPPLTGDPQAPVNEFPPDREVGSLWRRIVAVLIDSIAVGIAGTLIALPFFEFFSRLGAWGRLVGFCLAVPYFVLLNSRIGKGQTLGKCAMHLQVVNSNGDVVPCCYDVASEFVMGNLFRDPLDAIWRGEKFRAFRRRVERERNAIRICAGCPEGRVIRRVEGVQ